MLTSIMPPLRASPLAYVYSSIRPSDLLSNVIIIQRGFYVAIAAIPVSFAIYKFTYSDPSSKPYLHQIIEKYSDFKNQWDDRNALHTVMIEQAAHDRNLFQSERVDTEVELRFPEWVNPLRLYSQYLHCGLLADEIAIGCSIQDHHSISLPVKEVLI